MLRTAVALILQQAASPDPPQWYLRLLAFGLVGWYLFALWVWLKYRAPDQPWTRFFFGSWVLVDQRTFRVEGRSWLHAVRWMFLVVVLPLIAVLFWRWPVGSSSFK